MTDASSLSAARHPLTRYRQRHGLTLAAFATLVGTTKGTISRIETGTREPAMSLLRQIVAATNYEVSADDIIHWPRLRQPVRRICDVAL
jgi:transcriptional regulator with XRE-family HTH domain